MRKLLIIVACSSVFMGLAVLTWTVLSQDIKPAAANNALSIHACSFQEPNNSYDMFRDSQLNNTSGSGPFTYCAPVNLPHGSTIRKIKFVCKDYNLSKNIDLRFYRVNLDHDIFQLAEVSSNGSDTNWRTFSTSAISTRYVNNLGNSYYVKVWLPGIYTDGFRLSQVKILYDAP